MANAADKVHKSRICAKPKPLRGCLKTANINLEPVGCTLASTICNAFSCQKFSCKTPTRLPKHICFRLVADNSLHTKKFDFEPTHMPGLDPSEENLYLITVPLSVEL